MFRQSRLQTKKKNGEGNTIDNEIEELYFNGKEQEGSLTKEKKPAIKFKNNIEYEGEWVGKFR